MKHPTSNIQHPEKPQAPIPKQRPGNFVVGTCRAAVIKTRSSALELELGAGSFSGSWNLVVGCSASLRKV